VEQSLSQTVHARATIVNELGLHARPATELVDVAGRFDCDVTIRNGDNAVDGKSIMQVMLLAATTGTALDIECRGPDADKCAGAIVELIEQGFNEE